MNKKMTIGVLVVVVIASVWLFGGSKSGDVEGTATDDTTQVDMSAIADNLDEVIKDVIQRGDDENVVLLDVRTDSEWNASHVVGAVHYGLEEHLKQGNLPDIDKDKQIYVYCRSGNRAGQAIRILQDAGYTNLINIRGLDDWVRNEGPTVAGVDGDDQ